MSATQRRCSCEHPSIYLHDQDNVVLCAKCTRHARPDLKGDDEIARVKYRAELNRLRDKAASIEVARAEQRKADRKAATERRKQMAIELRASGHSWAETAIRVGVSKRMVRIYCDPDYAASAQRSMQKYRAANPDKIKAAQQRTRDNSREARRQASEAWRRRNPNRRSNYMREYRKEQAA